MRPKVLITAKIHPIAKELLSKKFEVTTYEEEILLSKKQLQEAVTIYDGILSTFYDSITKDVLDRATRTRVISNYAVGLDNVDIQQAKKKNIEVFHLPDVVTNSTADITFALLLSWARQIVQSDQYIKKEGWKVPILQRFQGEELYGKTLGILGYGRIGKAVAQRALGFGLKVICAHRREISLQERFEGKVHQVSVETLYKTVDYLCIHVPLTEETKGMIGKKELKQMKNKPLVLNMARGAVICTEDLLEALKTNQIRGFVADVTDPEPLPKDHPLLQYANCLITPHIGTSTKECRKKMAEIASNYLINFF